VKVYVNGDEVPHRILHGDEIGMMANVKDDVVRVFLILECPPCQGGDNVTCDAVPPNVDQVWARVPCRDWRGRIFHGTMRLFPDRP